MRRLTLIRHAKSSWSDPALSDFDRPLNKRGRRNAPFMGALLKATETRFDRVYSSPARRALDTARLICGEVGYDPGRIEEVPSLYHATAEHLLSFVRGLPNDLTDVALVAHNPGLTDLVNSLSDSPLDNVPTAGIVTFKVGTGGWGEFGGDPMPYEFDYPKKPR